MNVLIIGNGGREHILAWKLRQSPRLEKLYCLPGNGGTTSIAENVSGIQSGDFKAVIAWVKELKIDMTVIGPEQPLADGIVDAFQAEGLRVFGPVKAAARLESSKDFSKQIMKKYGVPTSDSRSFDSSNEAFEYLETKSPPFVIKADGLAAGKGVVICENLKSAKQALDEIMEKKILGNAGARVLIEDFLRGEEVSVLAFTDGDTILPMISAQDHKNIFEGDKGPNTGGMGAYAPSGLIDIEMQTFIHDSILRPVIEGLKKDGIRYKGVLYAGLMMTDSGPKVVEFNTRFGDPEVQCVLPMLKNDLLDIIDAVIDSRLEEIKLQWQEGASACVVMASGGYPSSYEKNKLIMGLEKVSNNMLVIHAGTKKTGNDIFTDGGRVLNFVCRGKNLKSALDVVYSEIGKVSFEKSIYRKDIGWKALKRKDSLATL